MSHSYPKTTGLSTRRRADHPCRFRGRSPVSSDFGALLLRGVDRQIGLTERLAAAIHEKRHQSYIDHPLRDLLAQRIYQIASGYADANDANHLRHDPLFKLGVERPPLEAEHDLASAPDVPPSGAPNGPQRHLPTHTRLGNHSSPATPSPLSPLSSMSTTPMIPRMGSRSLPSIIITIRTIAIFHSSFLKGPRTPSSRPTCARAPVPRGQKMRWSGPAPLVSASPLAAHTHPCPWR